MKLEFKVLYWVYWEFIHDDKNKARIVYNTSRGYKTYVPIPVYPEITKKL